MSVANPSVVRTDTGYAMYYNGVASLNDSHGAIGMATSTDGIHWRKYNNPATTDPLYAKSDPVLLPGASGAWDAQRMVDPNVVRTENGWVMVYLSAAPPGTRQRTTPPLATPPATTASAGISPQPTPSSRR